MKETLGVMKRRSEDNLREECTCIKKEGSKPQIKRVKPSYYILVVMGLFWPLALLVYGVFARSSPKSFKQGGIGFFF